MRTPVRISYYWPPLGGTNCAVFVSGECISDTASGEPWREWIDRGAACPPEWEFGRTFELAGTEWTCVDRGSAIRYEDGVPWVDLLTEEPPVPFGTITEVVMR